MINRMQPTGVAVSDLLPGNQPHITVPKKLGELQKVSDKHLDNTRKTNSNLQRYGHHKQKRIKLNSGRKKKRVIAELK